MNKTFVSLVKEAIGEGRTQKQFAAESGISAEHLSRILKNPERTPSGRTLEKIADHSEGRVTLADLKRSLSMEVTDEDKKTQIGLLPSERRNAIVAGDIRKGVKELALSRPVKYVSLDEFADTLHMLYGWGEYRFDITEDDEYTTEKGNSRYGAERLATVLMSWEDEESLCEMAFVLFYCKTEKGIIITDAAFDLDTLLKYGHPLAYETEALLEGDGIDTKDCTLVYVTTFHKKLPEQAGAAGITADMLIELTQTPEEVQVLKKLINRAGK